MNDANNLAVISFGINNSNFKFYKTRTKIFNFYKTPPILYFRKFMIYIQNKKIKINIHC